MTYKVEINAAPKQLQEMMQDVIDKKIDTAKELKPIPPGVLPTLNNEQDCKMDLAGPGTWTHSTMSPSLVLTGTEKAKVWWDKDSEAWSIHAKQDIKGDNGDMLATEYTGTSADAGLTYPKIRVYQGKIYRVKSGQTTVAGDNPSTSSKYELIGGGNIEEWSAKQYNAKDQVTKGNVLWEVASGQTALATDIPAISSKWIPKTQEENTNINFAAEFNQQVIRRASSLNANQDVKGFAVHDWSGYTFDSYVEFGRFVNRDLNLWINGELVGTGNLTVRTYNDATLVTTKTIAIDDFSGDKYITNIPAGNYNRIYVGFNVVSSTNFWVSDVYIGFSNPKYSIRSNKISYDILKSVNPIQYADWFVDENKYIATFTKENKDTFVLSQGNFNKSYRINDVSPFLDKGIMYVSFMMHNTVVNEGGFHYTKSESGTVTVVGNTDWSKNTNVWKEYYLEIPVTANTDYVELFLRKNTTNGVTKIKNFIVSDIPHRQGNGRPINIRDYPTIKSLNPFPKFDFAITNPTTTGYTKVGNKLVYTANASNMVVQSINISSQYAGKTLYLKYVVSNYSSLDGASGTAVYRNSAGTQLGTTPNLSLLNTNSLPVPVGTDRIDVQFKSPTSSAITLEDIILSDSFINSNSKIENALDFSEIRNRNVLNIFPFASLTPVTKGGTSESLPFITTEGIDSVLNIQKLSSATYLMVVDSEYRKTLNLSFRVFSPKNRIFKLRERLTNATTGVDAIADVEFHVNAGSWDNVYITRDFTNISQYVLEFFNTSTETVDVVKIKNAILTEDTIRQTMNNVVNKGGSSTGFSVLGSLVEAIAKNTKGVFAVGSMLFKNINNTVSSVADYNIITDNRKPTVKKMFAVEYIDTKGLFFRHIDKDENIWLSATSPDRTWVVTRDEFESALSAPIVRPVGYTLSDGTTQLTEAETHRELIVASLPAPRFSKYILGCRDLGIGEVVAYTYDGVAVTSGNKSALTVTANPDLTGGFINGWLFDVKDNVVLIGGYFSGGDGSGETRGKGKLWISTDYGQTFTKIFDAETTTLPKGDRFHIHGCAFDQYWNRCWMVVGDSTQATTPGKIFYCDNYASAEPTWVILPYNRQTAGGYEQWCTVYPAKDYLLFGADMNPTTLSRMARLNKSDNTLRESVIYIHDSLSHVPSAFHQWNPDTPIILINGVQNSAVQDSDPNCRFGLYCTINGNEYFEVYKDKIKSLMYDTQNTCFYLPDHRIFTSKKDVRFSGEQTMLRGKLGEWI